MLGTEIFFDGSGDRRMKLSNEDELTLDLEKLNYIDVDYFVEKELESFFFFLWILSMDTFEHEEVNIDEEEGNWLDSVFKEGVESSDDLNSGGGCSFG